MFSHRQKDVIFANNCIPTEPASYSDDILARMAHSMGCGVFAEDSRQDYPAYGQCRKPDTPVIRRPLNPDISGAR